MRQAQRLAATAAAVLWAGLAAQQAAAQPADTPASGLAETAIVFRSIDPADTDFADLAPLAEAIGDARVVVLGEQSHGEGPVFLAKARLVKFLHQEMGFDVLCWESGMLGCLVMDEHVADGSLPLPEGFEGVFPIWTRSAQVVPTLEYVRQSHASDRPITSAGMDAQVHSARGVEAFQSRARALVDSLDGVVIDPQVTSGLELMSTIAGGMRPDVAVLRQASVSLAMLEGFLAEHRDRLNELHDPTEVELITRTTSDAAWFTRMMAAQLAGANLNDDPDLMNERDRRMGDNLVWLADEYFAGRKIIVWAATRHAVHRQKEIVFPDAPGIYDNMDSMGETAHAKLGDDLYTIGFTAGRGSVSNVFRDQPYPIGEPRGGSVEASLDANGRPFQFLDFRGLPADHPMRESRWMRPLGYAWQTAIWPEQMDAVIWIDRVFPSTAGEPVPDGYTLTDDGFTP